MELLCFLIFVGIFSIIGILDGIAQRSIDREEEWPPAWLWENRDKAKA